MIRIFVMMDAIDFTGSKPPYRFPIIRSSVTGRQEQALQRASQPYHPVQSSAYNKAWSGLQHAPITYDNGGQDVYSYTYDANGNQVERVTSSGTYSLTYNVENKLIEVGFAAQQSAAQGIEPLSEVEALAEPEPTPEAVEEDTETEEEQEAPPDGSLNLWERLVAFVDNLLTRMQMPGTYLSIGAPVYSAQRMFQEQDPTATVEPEPTATQTATPEAEATQTETAAPNATRTQEPTPELTPEPVETLEPAPTEITEEVIELEPEMAIEMVTSLQSAVYVYDGDGNLVKSIINEVVTYYAGRHYHKMVDGTNVNVKKFYAIGMSQIAVRTNGDLNWVLTDHLSSASVSASVDGTLVSEVKYSAYGEIRPIQGTLPTDYQFTGQLSQMDEIGLLFYVARWADPLTGHFVQADTIVPSAGNAGTYNRYAYARYNPIRYSDPSGHKACSSDGDTFDTCTDPLATPASQLAKAYGITFSGTWSEKQMGVVVATAAHLGLKIAQSANLNFGAAETFVHTFGEMSISSVLSNNICDGCHGQVSYPSIKFIASGVNARLVAHEFAHAFERAIWSRNGGNYAGTNNPIQFLTTNAIYDVFGGFVTGTAYDSSDGSTRYRRWNGPPPGNGFISNHVPNQYHGEEFSDWNDPGEGWADIFLNWTFSTFSLSPAGKAMNSWVTTNMADWVNYGR